MTQSAKDVKNEAFTKIYQFRAEILFECRKLLEEDLNSFDPVSAEHPDAYMHRMYQYMEVLYSSKFYAILKELATEAVKSVVKHREYTHKRISAASLYYNAAAACYAQDAYDEMVYYSLKGTNEEDKYGPMNLPSRSAQANEALFESLRGYAYAKARSINPNLDVNDMLILASMLGKNREIVLLGYLQIARKNFIFLQSLDNEFSRLQVFAALRNIACLFEVELKALASQAEGSLFRIMEKLYGKKLWWCRFENVKNTHVQAKRESLKTSDEQLATALALKASDPESLFWQGLIVGYIVRNFTAHNLDASSDLAGVHFDHTLGHLLNVMLTCKTYL
jgi:hypothetical protein